jgi:UDP-N-acetyl-D-mannosaminuronic acid transferase (WecB/TagA/CpsF family)
VGIGVGASLEFLAHVKRRAPAWLQKMRLEFAWRFLQEPARLGKRYLRDYIYWRHVRREWEAEVKMGRETL